MPLIELKLCFANTTTHSPLRPPKMSDQSETLLWDSIFGVTNSDSSMFCATVVKLQIKSVDGKWPFRRKLLQQNPLNLTLCQKPSPIALYYGHISQVLWSPRRVHIVPQNASLAYDYSALFPEYFPAYSLPGGIYSRTLFPSLQGHIVIQHFETREILVFRKSCVITVY